MTHRWTVALIVTLPGVLAPSLARAQDVVFERDVLPIFAGRCLNCHGSVTKKADLDLRNRESFPPIVSATAAKWFPRFSPEVLVPSVTARGCRFVDMVVRRDIGPGIVTGAGFGQYARCWTSWLAGGGFRGGQVIGRTDDAGGEVL